MSVADASRRIAELYQGDSKPLVPVAAGDAVLDIVWWLNAPRKEGADRDRHGAALRLYVELGRGAAYDLGGHAFPAVFDLEGGAMRPDKGAIKTFFNNGLLKAWMTGAQLIFELTDAGRARLDQTNT